MTIGQKIKQRREALGLTQEELAKKVGYASRSSINKIELSRDLPLSKVSKMATALETSPSFLMGWTDNPDPNYPNTIDGQMEEAGSRMDFVNKTMRSQVENSIKDAGIAPEIFKDVDVNSALGIEQKSTSGKTYYFDDEAAELAQELFVNEGQRILMSASRGLKPDAIKALAEIAKQMKATNPEG